MWTGKYKNEGIKTILDFKRKIESELTGILHCNFHKGQIISFHLIVWYENNIHKIERNAELLFRLNSLKTSAVKKKGRKEM